jgi:hypothetical protein
MMMMMMMMMMMIDPNRSQQLSARLDRLNESMKSKNSIASDQTGGGGKKVNLPYHNRQRQQLSTILSLFVS